MRKCALPVIAVLILVTDLLSQAPGGRSVELEGGTELTYGFDMSHVAGDRVQAVNEAKTVISKRLEAHGLERVEIAIQDGSQLVIRLPRMDRETFSEVKGRIERVGALDFRLVAPDQDPALVQRYEKEWEAYIRNDRKWVEEKRRNPSMTERRPQPPKYIVCSEVEKVKEGKGERFAPKPNGKRILENFHATYDEKTRGWIPEGSVSGSYLDRVSPIIEQATSRPAIGFRFAGEGASRLSELTGNNKGRDLAIVLDGDILQIARIRDQITGSGQLSGDFSEDDVKRIIEILGSGSLKARPILISERTMEPGK